MGTTSYETVLIDVADGVATLTLNRPDALNAFNTTLDVEFHEAMWELERDDDIRVIVVTGAGKAFSSGLDLTDGGAALSGAEAAHEGEMGLTADTIPDRSAFWKMRTPVIAAINGAAVGAALNVALLMDILIVAEDAKLRLPFNRIGVVPDANATWLLPRLIGTQRALELFWTGRFFDGREAVELGLALKAVPNGSGRCSALTLKCAWSSTGSAPWPRFGSKPLRSDCPGTYSQRRLLGADVTPESDGSLLATPLGSPAPQLGLIGSPVTAVITPEASQPPSTQRSTGLSISGIW